MPYDITLTENIYIVLPYHHSFSILKVMVHRSLFHCRLELSPFMIFAFSVSFDLNVVVELTWNR